MSSEPRRRGAPIRSISAVLPAHNEAANIVPVVTATLDALSDVVPDFELIIVDDGSKDATARLADDLAGKHSAVRVIHHPKNLGYGSAWRSGIMAATKQYIFFMDADRQFDPAELARLVQWGEAYDAVVGYRIHRNDPVYRFMIGKSFALMVRALFGIRLRDIDCGFKLFRTTMLKSMTLEAPGALINTEIHYRIRQRQADLREVGVHHYPRKVGKQSGASVRVIFRAAGEVIALRRRLNREQRALRATTQDSSAAEDVNSKEEQ
jgi:glycosyltransferase involved in cell wall biosynthesis